MKTSQTKLLPPNIVKRKLSSIKGRKLVFKGETFLYIPKTKELFFHIREPYYSSGKRYGWNPPIGLGINEAALNFAVKNNLRICVFVGSTRDRYYATEAHKWKRFAERHKSIEKHGSTKIYIMQFSNNIFNTIFIDTS